jgi:hypothetical protein
MAEWDTGRDPSIAAPTCWWLVVVEAEVEAEAEGEAVRRMHIGLEW